MFDNVSLNASNRFAGNNIFSASLPNSTKIDNDWFKPIQFDYTPFWGNDLMSSLFLFNMYLKNTLPPNIINKQFNTKTNLASLRQIYNPELGNAFANIANKNARSTDTVGWCLKSVRRALDWAGLHKGGSLGSSAYQAVGNLSNNKNFKQVQVSRGDLKSLPAGCIIVWNRTSKNPHGHIAVTLGNGKEASDHVQNLITNMNTSFTVFAPTKGQIA